jgi:hypothetical protein
MKRRKPTVEEQIAAEEALAAIKSDDGDEAIAQIVADYLLTSSSRPSFHLTIFHDIRSSTTRRVEKLRKTWPDYKPENPIGPCSVPFDWHCKNTVGITTRDRERARCWIIDALLAGYGVFRGYRRGGTAWGQGSLAQIRRRAP